MRFQALVVVIALVAITACGGRGTSGGGPDSGVDPNGTRNTILFYNDSYEMNLGGPSIDFLLDGVSISPMGGILESSAPEVMRGVPAGTHTIELRDAWDESFLYSARFTL